jgi:exonuclease III
MHVIAWNIRNGGDKRAEAIAATLRERNPEIIVLGEYQVIPTRKIINELMAGGWVHHALSHPPDQSAGVAIISKIPFVVQSIPEKLKPFAFRYQAVDFPSVGFNIRGIYAPLKKGRYGAFWTGLLETLKQDGDTPVLVVGDFNSGTPNLDTPVSKLFCSSYFNQLPDCGFTDLWRKINGSDAREYTWMGRVNPIWLDHTFGSPRVADRLIDCVYDHSVRENLLSDHSLLSIKIAQEKSIN